MASCGCWALFGSGASAHDKQAALFSGRICAFGPSPVYGRVTNLGPPSPEAVKIVERITQSVGIRSNFKIIAADIERYAKAFATIENGRRVIVYNRAEFNWSDGKADWSDVGTMAHEVGHHIASHVFTSEYGAYERELEADRFSGFAMFKMGASIVEAASRFWDWPATQYHPGGLRRREAVEAGWINAKKMKQAEGERCMPGWESAETDIDGSVCRIARTCEDGTPQSRLACQDYDGAWHWAQRSPTR